MPGLVAPATAGPGRSGRRRRSTASYAASVERSSGASSHRCSWVGHRPTRIRRSIAGLGAACAPRAAPAGGRRPATGRPPCSPRRTTSGSASSHGPDPPSRAADAAAEASTAVAGQHHLASGVPDEPEVSTTTGSGRRRRATPRPRRRRPPARRSAAGNPCDARYWRLEESVPVPTWLQRMLPDDPVARRLSVQSILFAFGEGTFITGSAVFFTQIVGLTAAQVGLGCHSAASWSLTLSVPLGKLADRFGPSRMWAVGALLEALLYLSWPLIHGFPAFFALMTAFSLVETVGNAGRGAYTIASSPARSGCAPRPSCGSALNIGFTLGALGRRPRARDRQRRRDPDGAGVHRRVLAINALLIARLPDAHEEPVAGRRRREPRAAGGPGREPEGPAQPRLPGHSCSAGRSAPTRSCSTS